MKQPEVIINWDSEAEAFVSYLPALDLYSAGITEDEARAAVFSAAEMAFSWLKEQVEQKLIPCELT